MSVEKLKVAWELRWYWAPHWAMWLAADSNGDWCWFEKIPEDDETGWRGGGAFAELQCPAAPHYKDKDWRRSLEHRRD